MVRARPVILLAVALLAGGAAASARAATVAAPTGLHAFLLRADEPARTAFSRTPSFAWSPVPGADHYEFQLSLSDTFRDNSVVYASSNLPSPVIAPPLTLPWITGNPHSLYARVRAVTIDGTTTPWSASYGFDMIAPAPPTPLPSYPGLLRWTPIEGVAGYQVWLVDAGKMETVTTNVLDEREFYTFHESQPWMGTVRWRIRVIRLQDQSSSLLNSIPAADYGPWSPTYVSTNPPFSGGQLKLIGTVSDVFSDGSDGSPAHRLMPAFLFSGNTGLDGTPYELFRVEVFTDRQCLNRVYTGAVTGAPAYSPRPFGPLALPASTTGIAAARNSFLSDGAEPSGVTPDGTTLKTTELAPGATPTGSAPSAPGQTTSATGSTGASSSGTTSSSNGGASGTITWSGEPGAPVDLWDTDWPHSGYYWTVIPVSTTPPNNLRTTIAGAANAGDTVLPVTNSNGFASGDTIQIGTGASQETVTVAGVSTGQLTLTTKLVFGHGFPESVVRLGGVQYYDTELAQDACASGRVARFGKSSEPSLTASGDLFATGLSSTGRLTSALHTTAFYGQPLVSWTPALGAFAYEVQWSKVKYPFKPEPVPGGNANGFMTTATSLVLPVGPGVWYYRVRGFDYSLPTNAQQMSWSDPAKLVVAKPRFKVVGGATAPKAKPKAKAKPKSKPAAKPSSAWKRVPGAGFSVEVPTAWTPHPGSLFRYDAPKSATNVNVLVGQSERGTKSDADWLATIEAQVKVYAAGPISSAIVSLPAGKAVRITTTARDGQTTKDVLQYIVDNGLNEFVVTFVATPTQYRANLATFGHEIASFQITN